MITSHVPPGDRFHKKFNKRFLQILTNHRKVISGLFFGHNHTDTFRVLSTGDEYIPMYLSPPLTPFLYKNPSVRLYEYDKKNGKIENIHQFYLNLTSKNPRFEKEYEFKKVYELNNAHGSSLNQLANSMRRRTEVYQKFCRFLNVSSPRSYCHDADIKWSLICALKNLREENLNKCIHRHKHKRPDRIVPKYMLYLIVVLSIIAVLLFILVTFICCCKKRVIFVTRPRYVLLSSSSIG